MWGVESFRPAFYIYEVIMAKKRIKLENVIGKVRTSMFGPQGMYKVEDGVVKPLKLDEQKEIKFNVIDLI